MLRKLTELLFRGTMCELTPQVQRLFDILQKSSAAEKTFTERFPASAEKINERGWRYYSFWNYGAELNQQLDQKGWRTGLPPMDFPLPGRYQDQHLMNALSILQAQSESMTSLRMVIKDYQNFRNPHHYAIGHILSHLDDLEQAVAEVGQKDLADLQENHMIVRGPKPDAQPSPSV